MKSRSTCPFQRTCHARISRSILKTGDGASARACSGLEHSKRLNSSISVVKLLLFNRLKERGSENNRFTLLHQGKLPSHSTNNPKTDWNGNLFPGFFNKWDEDVLGVFDFMLQGR